MSMDTVGGHLLEAPLGIPASRIDLPEDLAADHHGGIAIGSVFDRRPERVLRRCSDDGSRNEVRMNIDCVSQERFPYRACF